MLRRLRSWTLSRWILIGLALGVATGLFLGELAAPLEVVATAFIRLLQMAVLPYIVVSLTGALGRLEVRDATSIARAGAGALAAVWGAALIAMAVMPLTFPDYRAGTFFSTSLVEPAASFDLVEQYIPANPFRSLAENVVPAVVLFSIAVGIGLMRVPGRDSLIASLDVLAKALTHVNDFVVKLTPIGLFAIAGSTTGTLGIEDFERVQVYVLGVVLIGVLLAFGILPALVASVTRLGYREIVSAARDPVLTALATGSLFVVLPQLAERTKALMARVGASDEESERVVDVIVPVSFNFPHGGKLLTLGFVAFAAWAAGTPFGFAQMASLAASGVLSLFGSVYVALPYLLDRFGIPADMFQLFVAVSVVNFRVATMVATMHTLALGLLVTATVSGRIEIHWPRVARVGGVAVAALLGLVGAMAVGFTQLVAGTETRAHLVTQRRLLGPEAAATVRRSPVPAEPAAGGSALARARARGTIRVGYDAETLPFAYFNDADQLVGLDVDMAHALALDLGLDLDLVPMNRERLAEELNEGAYDVAMSSIALTTERSGTVGLSRPYLDLTMAFVVRDDRRHEFNRRERVRELEGLRIGMQGAGYYGEKVRRYLPEAEFVEVASLGDFFERPAGELDALVHAAEIAAAWTLIHPHFTVVVPQPDRLRVPVAYAVGIEETEMRDLVDTWILLKRSDQTIDRLYRYWVLGDEDRYQEPRWSVIRNVLGWVD